MAEILKQDEVTVTAISRGDPSVGDNDSCVMHSLAALRGFEVSISPAKREWMPGDELNYTIDCE